MRCSMIQRLPIPMLLLAPLLAQPQPADFDPGVFKTPPAQYRGHAMWSFPLSTLNENYVTSGIDEMARLMKYYPALWYDIGPQTAAARNALWGHRAVLFATNFIKRLNDWCAARGLRFGGHLDQEDPVNPVSVTGDLMKVFEHQTLPTVDDIWWYGRSNVSYKIVTSRFRLAPSSPSAPN
jgi:hypothetical protein